MRKKTRMFREALGLVWKSSPFWTSANVIVSLLRSFLPLVLILLLKFLIDSITSPAFAKTENLPVSILLLIIAVVAVYFLDETASGLGNYVRKKQSVRLEAYMYNLLHQKAVRLDLINFENPEYYDCLARASREAPWRPNNILNNLVSLLQGVVSLLLMAGLILTLHWSLAALLLLANLPAVWLRLRYASILYSFQRDMTPEARKTAYFNWLLTGDRPSREIRLFGLGEYFISLFRQSFTKQKDEELRIIRKRTAIEIISNLFKAAAFFYTIWYIADDTVKGTITIGQMAMFLVAFRQGMAYMRDFFSSLAGLYEDSLFIEDTFEFLGLTENIRSAGTSLDPAPLRQDIVAEDLSFTYPGNKARTIDGVSVTIRKGEVVAIVGANGAGKSTLVRLLCRLYDPDSGTIKYDGENIIHYDPEQYRRQFSVVFQDFMLYNLLAGENIRLGDIQEAEPQKKVREAARYSGADEIISALPAGYETMIGNLFNESRELSWGEWQKIAIARALFRNASVLILDEPSSALDADSEYEIFSRFREIVKGKTSVLISHRFNNVSLADRILVLEKGKIVETGTHEELIALGGIYSGMYKKQSNRFNNK